MPARNLVVALAVLGAVSGPAVRPGLSASQPLSPGGGLSAQLGGSAPAAGFRGSGGLLATGAADPYGFRDAPGRDAGLMRPARPVGHGEAFVASLLLPGLSQYRQGNHRWIAYAGIEVLFAVRYLNARADTRELRTAYRDFAWTKARLGVSARPRRDGDFEYYERLSRWAASGAWDADPRRDGLQPESDPATYNGSVWALAGEIFNVDPSNPEGSSGYPRALEYYRERGYGPPLLWEWRGGGGDRDVFRGMIEDSDRRARDARLALWIVLGNHLLSAIDGFVTARLAVSPSAVSPALVVTMPVR